MEGDVYQIENSTFEWNTATTSGGAIAVASESGFVRLIRDHSFFMGNTAQENDGGAIFTVEGGAIGSIDSSDFKQTKSALQQICGGICNSF